MSKYDKIIAHLCQPSTIRGLVTILTLVGIIVPEEKINALTVAASFMYGFWDVYRSEKK